MDRGAAPSLIPAATCEELLSRWEELAEVRRQRPAPDPGGLEAVEEEFFARLAGGGGDAAPPPEPEPCEPPDWPEFSPLDSPPDRRPPYHPEQLLALLPHLRLEPGRGLDYVYREEEFGHEMVLYTRREDGPHFSKCAEVPSPDRALPGLVADGSPESLFELALFRVLGEGLYLREYEDLPLFTKARFLARARRITQNPGNEIFPVLGGPERDEPVDWEARFAGEPEAFFLPAVTVKPDGTADVVWFWHTDWGGIQRRTHTVGPGAECRLTGRETLVPYDCGIIY